MPRASAARTGRPPTLLWVGNRPFSARVPKAPQPPSEMAVNAYLKVGGAFREDPRVTLEHKDS